MKIEQLSVFVENKFGRLANIALNLGETGINIRAMSLVDTSDFGILRLVVDDPKNARKMLRDRGFTVTLTEVLLVKIPDRPGELGKLLKIIEKNGLNIEYVYGLTQNYKNHAILIMRFDDLDKAIRIFDDEKVSLVKMEDIINV